MLATCGKHKWKERYLNHLSALGQALHKGLQPLVFDDGFVSLVEQRESEVNEYAATPTRHGSEAGSRQGRPTSWRSRPPGEAKSFRSTAVEEAHGAGFRLLAQHYDALGVEDRNGLWVAVKTSPVGRGGPQAYLLIAAPNNFSISPRAWAFESIGHQARPFALKHTNFPDASICAFTKESEAWLPEDGLLPLVDHFSLWVVKSWHRTKFGWWPGDQVGACALYRRLEFAANEFCGCGSRIAYGICHRIRDMRVPESLARDEFKRLFLVDYQNRQHPQQVLSAARHRWKIMPDMASVYLERHGLAEPAMPLF